MGDQFWGEIWDLLNRMGCDHPCVSLCLVVDIWDCFIIGGVPMSICVLFSLFGWGFRFEIFVLVYFYSFLISCFCIVYYVLAFYFVGVVAIWLPMRTLWDLGVGEEPNCLQNVFGVFGVILYYFIQLWSFVAWLLVCIWVEVHDRYLSQECHFRPRFQPYVFIVVL